MTRMLRMTSVDDRCRQGWWEEHWGMTTTPRHVTNALESRLGDMGLKNDLKKKVAKH